VKNHLLYKYRKSDHYISEFFFINIKNKIQCYYEDFYNYSWIYIDENKFVSKSKAVAQQRLNNSGDRSWRRRKRKMRNMKGKKRRRSQRQRRYKCNKEEKRRRKKKKKKKQRKRKRKKKTQSHNLPINFIDDQNSSTISNGYLLTDIYR